MADGAVEEAIERRGVEVRRRAEQMSEMEERNERLGKEAGERLGKVELRGDEGEKVRRRSVWICGAVS